MGFWSILATKDTYIFSFGHLWAFEVLGVIVAVTPNGVTHDIYMMIT